MAGAQIFLQNDNNILIRGLRREDTQAYINDAVLTAVVKDQYGNTISGASSISLAYTTASNGEYRGLLPYTVQLTEGELAYVTVTSSNYPGFKVTKAFPIKKRSG